MKRKFRIKKLLEEDGCTISYAVQMHLILGLWITVKKFSEATDYIFSYLLADELLDKLEEA